MKVAVTWYLARTASLSSSLLRRAVSVSRFILTVVSSPGEGFMASLIKKSLFQSTLYKEFLRWLPCSLTMLRLRILLKFLDFSYILIESFNRALYSGTALLWHVNSCLTYFSRIWKMSNKTVKKKKQWMLETKLNSKNYECVFTLDAWITRNRYRYFRNSLRTFCLVMRRKQWKDGKDRSVEYSAEICAPVFVGCSKWCWK